MRVRGSRWQGLEGAGKKSAVGLARKIVWANKCTRMAKLQRRQNWVQGSSSRLVWARNRCTGLALGKCVFFGQIDRNGMFCVR